MCWNKIEGKKSEIRISHGLAWRFELSSSFWLCPILLESIALICGWLVFGLCLCPLFNCSCLSRHQHEKKGRVVVAFQAFRGTELECQDTRHFGTVRLYKSQHLRKTS
jgi:hypothetical protein